MTTDEWFSLKPGHVICNMHGKNHRVVLKVSNGGRAITLPCCSSARTTTYVSGDKRSFKIANIKVKLKWLK